MADNLSSMLHVVIVQQVSAFLFFFFLEGRRNKPYGISITSTFDGIFRQMGVLGKLFKQMCQRLF